MLTFLSVLAAVVLPQIPGVYQGPGCAGHPQRPPVAYTSRLKRQQIKALGYTDTDPRHYEEDHLVSLSLGGNPTSPLNLWPQPLQQAVIDDRIEWLLWHKACVDRSMTVSAAVRYEVRWKRLHG